MDNSPPFRWHRNDWEAGSSRVQEEENDEVSSDPFDIASTKNASIERLKRWRQATLVLNSSRRYRYTLDLKKELEKEEIRRKIRTHAQIIRAASLYNMAAEEQHSVIGPTVPSSSVDYGIGKEELTSIIRDHALPSLEHRGGVKGLADLLKTNLVKGITGDDADLKCRRSTFGSNTYSRKKGRSSFWTFLWESCQDLALFMLIVGAAVSLALGIKNEGIKEGWYDGVSTTFAVLLVIFVTAVNDYIQFLQFHNLKEEKQNTHLEVIRGGRRVNVSIFDIIVGDIVILKSGDQVPADGILVVGYNLGLDESCLTGGVEIVHKNCNAPFLMSGCKVVDGYGTMLVTCVGLDMEWGLLMASINEDMGEETALQVRLNGVATSIGKVGRIVAVLVLLALLVRYFLGEAKNLGRSIQFTKEQISVCNAVGGVAITIMVLAVPEGLPLAISLTLAYSVQKMMTDKALVRRLSACETMGFATTICSGKTGTLTLNQMTVVEAYVGEKKIDPQDDTTVLSPAVYNLLIEGIAQNTTGSVFASEGGATEIFGSPTEKAILSWGVNLGMKFDDVRSLSSIRHVFPFNSKKKRGGVAVQLPDSEVHIHWNGAAELVLALCTRYLDVDGNNKPMTEDQVTYFKGAIEDMAAVGLHCVAIAFRSFEVEKVPNDEKQLEEWNLPEDDLVLLAIVGIKDPCWPGIKDTVRLLSNAGVKVCMVTGDNLLTAKAVAMECGILRSDGVATAPNLIEGKVFRDMSPREREDVAGKISVMGSSSPNDKLLLVRALKKKGHVVAVTGDGTTDAPALSEADIGLAMGIAGTEVAKENSDIIILDNSFASIVKVVCWGRLVYANIQKFFQFELTVTVSALIIIFVAAVTTGNVPITAAQLLWVNLIVDTLGALALATEPPTDHLMLRSPIGRRESLVTNIMWRNLLVQALYQVTVLLVFVFWGTSILHLKNERPDYANKVENTFIFNTFVLCQIFNQFNARKPDEFNVFCGVTKNRLFIGIVVATLVVQIIIIEFSGKLSKTVKLNWKLWLASFAIAIMSWPIAVLGKFIPVPQKPLSEFFRRCLPHPRRRRTSNSSGNQRRNSW